MFTNGVANANTTRPKGRRTSRLTDLGIMNFQLTSRRHRDMRDLLHSELAAPRVSITGVLDN